MDEGDYAKVAPFRWYAKKCASTGSYYAYRNVTIGKKKQRSVMMHRVIMGIEYGDRRRVDHENGRTLDNRRSNLRFATGSQNAANRSSQSSSSSPYKGVTYFKANRKWGAVVIHQGKRHFLGLHDTPEQAAHAYDDKARELFGDFAYVNFPTKEK